LLDKILGASDEYAIMDWFGPECDVKIAASIEPRTVQPAVVDIFAQNFCVGNEIIAILVRHHRLICCAHHCDKHVEEDYLSKKSR